MSSKEKEVIVEAGSPILQSDGLYQIEVSSIMVEQQSIFVTWSGKEIHLNKNEVKQRRKSGDKYFITISPKVYESKFLKN